MTTEADSSFLCGFYHATVNFMEGAPYRVFVDSPVLAVANGSLMSTCPLLFLQELTAKSKCSGNALLPLAGKNRG